MVSIFTITQLEMRHSSYLDAYTDVTPPKSAALNLHTIDDASYYSFTIPLRVGG